MKKIKIKLSEMMPMCGIYKITNSDTGRVYVGQSKDIIGRWKEHLGDLVKGKHCNKKLLEDFQKTGLESFVAEVICLCSQEELLVLESKYIHEYEQLGGVYNNSQISGERMGVLRRRLLYGNAPKTKFERLARSRTDRARRNA